MEKEIIRRYTEEIINTGNVERISEYIGANYVEEYNEKRYQLGIEGAI